MKKKRARRQHDLGLTLLEMMIVLALIGLIAGAIGKQIFDHFKRGQRRTTALQVRELVGTAQTAMIDEPSCPTIEQLVAKGYVRSVPRDPWGTPLTLVCPSKDGKDPVDVTSAGPDKQAGTEDDINSWQL